MINITERLLLIIKEKAEGKYTVFAKNAGIIPTTMLNYIKGRLPSSESLINICKAFDVNITWLLTGRGEPYIDNQDKEMAGKASNRTLIPSLRAGQREGLQIEADLMDLVKKAIEIFESGTLYGTTLASNVDAFHQAIQAEKKISQMENELEKQMMNRLEVQDARVAHLEGLLEDLTDKLATIAMDKESTEKDNGSGKSPPSKTSISGG